MVKTFGLTHLALGVQDVERAFEFYEAVFGMVAVYRSEEFLQAQTPGARDVLVFERAKAERGKSGGVAHFGFRLPRLRSKRLAGPSKNRESSARESPTFSRATATDTCWRSGTRFRLWLIPTDRWHNELRPRITGR
jgi:catechol 2,3-dioxygenase-like lactoylglutathione lyase family enzyme